MTLVDLNADLGESFGRWRLGDDDALLGVVTSANVACGFHAGDPLTLQRTCAAAAAHGVVIGAQVGYRDLAGFGRRFIDIAPDDLRADVLYQLGGLDAMARAAGTRVRYLKPHGALYHAVYGHEEQAAAVIDALCAFDDALPVVGIPGSALFDAAAARGVRTVREVFADRAYDAVGRLVSRSLPGAVLHDPDQVAERALRMVQDGVVTTANGGTVAVTAESICVHGDSPGAVRMASAVRAALTLAGVDLAGFCAP